MENFFGKAFASKVYKRTPEKSYERIFNHLQEILPEADDEEIEILLK